MGTITTITKEELEENARITRERLAKSPAYIGRRFDEIEAWRTEKLAEAIALLETAAAMLRQADELVRQLDPSDDDEEDPEEGYAPLADEIDSALAELRGTP
jgi:DNA repair exonuclease SbcCD ATPase subunit